MDSNLLFIAAAKGDIKPFKDKAQNLEHIINESKETVLHVHIIKSWRPSIKFVEEILDICPSLLQQANDKGNTPLHVAAKQGTSDLLEFLLKRTNEAASITKVLQRKNSDRMTIFDVAMENKRNEAVKSLIKVHSDSFNFANNIGKILNLAAKSGDHEILDVVAKSPKGKSALLQELNKYDNSGIQSKDTILHININSSRSSTKFVEYILDLCSSLLLKVNAKRDTPLHIAAKCSNSGIVEVLLKHARDHEQSEDDQKSGGSTLTNMLTMKNSYGKTAFDVAVESKNIGVVKILIKQADHDFFDFANNIGKILRLAAESGDHEILDAVEQHPSGNTSMLQELRKYDLPGSQSIDTILHIHIKSSFWIESPEFQKKILNLCPSLLLKVNDKGDTSLHIAAKCGKSATTQVLLQCAKDQSQNKEGGENTFTNMLTMKNSAGMTAFDVAVENEEIEVVKILIKEADHEFFYFANNFGKILNLAAESGNHEILDAVAKDPKGKSALLQELRKSNISGTHSKDTILHMHINSPTPSTDFVKKVLEICPPLLLEGNDKGDTPLHIAAKWGEENIVKVLLKHAKNQTQKPDSEETPDKNVVVKCGQFAIVNVLKRARDQTKEEKPEWKIWKMKNYDGKTTLDIAMENDGTEVVKLLIQKAGSDFLDFEGNFRKILYFAAMTGDHEIVDAVAKNYNKMTDLDVAVVNYNIPEGTQSNDTILHGHIKSLKKPSNEFMKEILDKCPTLLVKVNEKGDTPLHVAAKCGHWATVKFLLQRARDQPQDLESGLRANLQMSEMTSIEGNKANCQTLRLMDSKGKNRADWQMMRMTNSEGNTALHEAVRNGKINVVKILTEDPDPNFSYHPNKAGETPLYLATARGYYKMVLAILRSCKSPAHEGPNGMTALHAAVMNSNISRSKSIPLENPSGMTDSDDVDFDDSNSDNLGNDDSNFDDSGISPLDIMAVIIKKINSLTKAKDQYGWTPLHYAAYYGFSNKVGLLLKFDKSAAYIPENRKMTALHMAASQGHKHIIENIISKCVECCEMVDNRGWNILHFAMLSLSKKELDDLLTHPLIGSLINKKDEDGNTPLHIRAAAYRDTFSHIGNRLAVNKKNISVEHMLKHGCHRLEGEIQILFEDVGDGQYQNGVIRDRKDDECFKIRGERRKKYYDGLKETKESHLLVAALIATVTFTAAFTIPGGYNNEGSNQGTAILTKDLAFQIFIITDTIGMTLSLSAVFVHFIMSFKTHESLLSLAFWLTILAMGTVVIAFITGVYAVLAPSSKLAIATCVLGLCFFLLVLYPLKLVYGREFLNWLRSIGKLFKRQVRVGAVDVNVLPTHFKRT